MTPTTQSADLAILHQDLASLRVLAPLWWPIDCTNALCHPRTSSTSYIINPVSHMHMNQASTLQVSGPTPHTQLVVPPSLCLASPNTTGIKQKMPAKNSTHTPPSLSLNTDTNTKLPAYPNNNGHFTNKHVSIDVLLIYWMHAIPVWSVCQGFFLCH